MMYYQEEKYGRAETHLLRCLKTRPDEPAVLNNLALVQKRLGKFNEAEKHILHALEKHPDLQELSRTRDDILKAKAAADAQPAK